MPRRWQLGLCTALLASLAGLAALDTPPGRQLWRRWWGNSCPFGFKTTTPLSRSAREAAYLRAAEQRRGSSPAHVPFALGFTLRQTSRQEVQAWAATHNAVCTSRLAGLGVECELTNFSVLPATFYAAAPGTLMLRFDAHAKLRAISALQQVPSAERAVQWLQQALSQQQAMHGAPHALQGAVSSSYLAQGALRQIAAAYRFADYSVALSATHMGKLGYISLNQTFTSLLD